MSRAALDDLIPQRIPKLLIDRAIETLTTSLLILALLCSYG